MIYMTVIGYKNLLSGYKRTSGAAGGRQSVPSGFRPRSAAPPERTPRHRPSGASSGCYPAGSRSGAGPDPAARAGRRRLSPADPARPRTGPRAGLFGATAPPAAPLRGAR